MSLMLGLGWVDQAVLAVLYGLVGLGRLELPSRPWKGRVTNRLDDSPISLLLRHHLFLSGLFPLATYLIRVGGSWKSKSVYKTTAPKGFDSLLGDYSCSYRFLEVELPRPCFFPKERLVVFRHCVFGRHLVARGGIWTLDLRVMGPTSYQTALLGDIVTISDFFSHFL